MLSHASWIQLRSTHSLLREICLRFVHAQFCRTYSLMGIITSWQRKWGNLSQ